MAEILRGSEGEAVRWRRRLLIVLETRETMEVERRRIILLDWIESKRREWCVWSTFLFVVLQLRASVSLQSFLDTHPLSLYAWPISFQWNMCFRLVETMFRRDHRSNSFPVRYRSASIAHLTHLLQTHWKRPLTNSSMKSLPFVNIVLLVSYVLQLRLRLHWMNDVTWRRY